MQEKMQWQFRKLQEGFTKKNLQKKNLQRGIYNGKSAKAEFLLRNLQREIVLTITNKRRSNVS